ncbi:MAG: FGGY family carbohydrate kinase [Gammaproteobacteria bacterium]
MVDSPLLVGVDAGTSRVRALVFTPTGRLQAEGSQPTPTRYPRPGWAEYDPEALWQAALGALRQALAQIDDPRRIAGLAVASVGEAGVALDAHDQPTAPVIAWFDERARSQAEWLERSIGKRQLFAISGLHLDSLFGLCKLLWLRDHQADAYRRTARWLNIADYLAWRLCGVAATDYSLASRTLALDIKNLRWSAELLREIGVDPALFQPLSAGGTRLATVTPATALASGLPEHCVVGVGGHDHIVGALPIGAWETGVLLDSLGSAEALMLALDQPLFADEFLARGYNQGAMVIDKPRYYAVGGMATSGACVEWFRAAIAGGADHEELIQEAEAIPPGSHGVWFLPHLRYGSPPDSASHTRGAFLGLSPDAKRGALYRAMLEGLAFDARRIVDGMQDLATIPPVHRILAIGGDSRNTLLMRIKTAVFRQPITVIELGEATSLGAAVLGGLAAGVYANVATALASLGVAHRTLQPEAAWVSAYRPRFDFYQRLPPVLTALNAEAATAASDSGISATIPEAG